MKNELFDEEMKVRLKKFAIRVMNLADNMPKTTSSWVIAKQIVRSGTSPFANYRAACRGKSDKDFINKLRIVLEELDETSGWLELIEEYEIFPKNRITGLQSECDELVKIIQSSITTMKKRMTNDE